MAARKAPLSIQPHIMFNRAGIRKLVAKHLSKGKMPDQRKTDFDDQLVVANGLLFIRLHEAITWNDLNEVTHTTKAALDKARATIGRFPTALPKVAEVRIPRKEAKVALGKGILSKLKKQAKLGGAVRELSRVKGPAGCDLIEMARAQLQEAGSDPALVGELAKKVLSDKCAPPTVLSRTMVLAETSKMGCYSFNMAAGPRKKFSGTCPA